MYQNFGLIGMVASVMLCLSNYSQILQLHRGLIKAEDMSILIIYTSICIFDNPSQSEHYCFHNLWYLKIKPNYLVQ